MSEKAPPGLGQSSLGAGSACMDLTTRPSFIATDCPEDPLVWERNNSRSKKS